MIQERAGSKTISSSVDLITLKKEKSYELWFESCRYQDIMRWSKLDNDSYDQECIARLKEQGMHIPHLCDKVLEKPSSIEGVDMNDVVWENGTEASSRFFIFHTHEAMDAGFEVGWKEKHREKIGEFLAHLQKSLYLCTNRSGYLNSKLLKVHI